MTLIETIFTENGDVPKGGKRKRTFTENNKEYELQTDGFVKIILEIIYPIIRYFPR
jgi:hypothetical protein